MHIHINASSPAHGLDKSPAQQARSLYNLDPGPNFGQIVSQIARGIYDPSNSADSTPSDADAGSSGTGSTTSDPTGDGSQSATSQDGSTGPIQPETTSTVDVSV